MKIIGITGGVGSGKSEILGWIEKSYDAIAVRADDIGRDLMRPGTACTKQIIDLFGPACADAEGRLDRAWIAEKIFRDDQLRDALNAIVHPAVRREIGRLILQNRACGWKYFFLETALMTDPENRALCDEVWYVYADPEVRISRLMEGRGYTEEKSRAVMDSQGDDRAFRSISDVVIDNSGAFEETAAQIERLMRAEEAG